MIGGITGKGFLPGQSGNPGGRPKAPNLGAKLAEIATRTELAGERLPRGLTVVDLFAETVWAKALVDFQWAKLLCDRLWGPTPAPALDDDDVRAALADRALDRVIADRMRRAAEGEGEATPDD